MGQCFWLSQATAGLDYGPTELAALVEEVTKERVAAIAQSVECDLIYFLCAGDGDGNAEEEEESDDAEA